MITRLFLYAYFSLTWFSAVKWWIFIYFDGSSCVLHSFVKDFSVICSLFVCGAFLVETERLCGVAIYELPDSVTFLTSPLFKILKYYKRRILRHQIILFSVSKSWSHLSFPRCAVSSRALHLLPALPSDWSPSVSFWQGIWDALWKCTT